MRKNRPTLHARQQARRAEICRRLAELAKRDGPDSIWVEMLVETEIRAARAAAEHSSSPAARR